MIAMHPKNWDSIKDHFPAIQIDDAPIPITQYGETICINDIVPERKIDEKWHPPQSSSRFVEYDESDEHWMRPAGFGRVEHIDVGPLFLRIEENMISRIESMMTEAMIEPPQFDRLFRMRGWDIPSPPPVSGVIMTIC